MATKEVKFFGFWYFFIHSKLKEMAKCDGTIEYVVAKSYLFQWRIPKYLRPVLLKELEIIGLIERINNKTIKIKDTEVDINNPSKLYYHVGLIPS